MDRQYEIDFMVEGAHSKLMDTIASIQQTPFPAADDGFSDSLEGLLHNRTEILGTIRELKEHIEALEAVAEVLTTSIEFAKGVSKKEFADPGTNVVTP